MYVHLFYSHLISHLSLNLLAMFSCYRLYINERIAFMYLVISLPALSHHKLEHINTCDCTYKFILKWQIQTKK